MIYKSFNLVHEHAQWATTLCADGAHKANNSLLGYVNKCCVTCSFVVIKAPIKSNTGD